jgi:hypothetical protein
VVALLSSGKLTPLEKRNKVERLVKTEVKENSVSIKREGGIFEAVVMSEPSVKIKSERIGGGRSSICRKMQETVRWNSRAVCCSVLDM